MNISARIFICPLEKVGDADEIILLQGKRFAEKHGLSVPRKIIHTLNAKPRFADANVFFSVSHSGSYWACAFANAEIGLDIQRFQPCLAESIARRFFHPNEAAWVKDRGEEGFFAVWTAKESYVKFMGEGSPMILQLFPLWIQRKISIGTEMLFFGIFPLRKITLSVSALREKRKRRFFMTPAPMRNFIMKEASFGKTTVPKEAFCILSRLGLCGTYPLTDHKKI